MSDALGHRVCIVDDDDDVRDSLKVLLEAYGLQVRDFASPAAFLAEGAARACECLIVDLHMPVMSGVELVEALRAQNIAVPALMVTGRPDPELAPRLENAGLTAVLAKPVSEAELLARVRYAVTAAVH